MPSRSQSSSDRGRGPAKQNPVREIIADVRVEGSVFLVLGVSALVLTLSEYLITPIAFERLFPADDDPLRPWIWASAGKLLLWGIVPYALARRLGFSPTDIGLGLGTLRRRFWLFVLLYLFMLIPLFWAASQPSFQDTYPYIWTLDPRAWRWRLLVAYWGLYALLFAVEEFFFRGFMLFALKPRFGYGAIAVMMVPYCMVHFHKPMPEALGSIVAGVILGWLAIKTNSIWGVVLLHTGVGLTMDFLALAGGGLGFPKTW